MLSSITSSVPFEDLNLKEVVDLKTERNQNYPKEVRNSEEMRLCCLPQLPCYSCECVWNVPF